MIPLHEMLNRIRWDSQFAHGSFKLGYYDRVDGRVILIPLKELMFTPDDPYAFRLVDAEGRVHRVPFHRVQEMHKDGQCIWQRPPSPSRADRR